MCVVRMKDTEERLENGYPEVSEEERKYYEEQCRLGAEMVDTLVDVFEGRRVSKARLRKLYRIGRI